MSIQEAFARLVSSRDVAEANPQADIRQLLLEGNFDLDPEDEPLLEVSTPSGGRIDIQAGATVIEVKRRLNPRSIPEWEEQLGDYVRDRQREGGQKWTAVLTDGSQWRLYDVTEDGQTLVGEPLSVRSGDFEMLMHWLGTILATRRNIPPTPEEVHGRLGVESPSFLLDVHSLGGLYAANENDPTVAVKRELWQRLLTDAFGTSFLGAQNQAELFVRHTYLVVVAEVIAHFVLGLPAQTGAKELLSGRAFTEAQIHGVVEEDFFDWVIEVPEGVEFIERLVRRIAQFDFSHPEHDILKTLYETVIDPETRRKLGEYYTPDWLAESMVEQVFDDPLNQRILDPACGSGSFLFWAIRLYLDASAAAGIPVSDGLQALPNIVSGIDLHPVAVTLARVTYLLAIGTERLAERTEPLSIPVFLGDAMSWRQPERLHTAGGIVVSTAASDEETGLIPLWDEDIFLDDSLLEQPAKFDLLIGEIASRAVDGRPLGNTLTRYAVPVDQRAGLEEVYRRFQQLHADGRNHVWSYFVRNLARPRSFRLDPVDRLIGNPPWLPYRNMAEPIKTRFKEESTERGLWSGGRSATQQDLSAYFVVQSVSQFLKERGKFGFVMPAASLNLRQYEGFRKGEWAGTRASFDRPWRLVHVKSNPPFFPVPSSVVFGEKTSEAGEMGVEVEEWSGRLPSGTNHQWSEVAQHIERQDGEVLRASERPHEYRDEFRNGATLYPRNLVLVIERDAGPLGPGPGRTAVRSFESTQAKSPWKDLDSLEGNIEAQFIRPVYLGEHVLPYRTTNPLLAVIPWDGTALLDHEHPDSPSGLANWWGEADRLWRTHARPGRSEETESLIGNVNYLSKLSAQFPTSGRRIVYTKAGNSLNAAVVTDERAVIDHKLYWAHAHTDAEAWYLCAIFNSETFREEVVGYQPVGLFGPRDFDKYLFEVPFPRFEQSDSLHNAIADAGQRAGACAESVQLDGSEYFTTARSLIRDALDSSGLSDEIDTLVLDLLTRPSR